MGKLLAQDLRVAQIKIYCWGMGETPGWFGDLRQRIHPGNARPKRRAAEGLSFKFKGLAMGQIALGHAQNQDNDTGR